MMRIHAKKLYYPAGIISLFFLPILCLLNLNKQKAFEKIGAIDVAYVYHKEISATSYRNTYKSLQEFRTYFDIEFSGNENIDKLKLNYAQLKVIRIIASKDTLRGVHIKFTNKAKYWNFVKAIEICYTKNINSRLDNNDLWLFYTPPVIEEKTYQFFCGTGTFLSVSRINEEHRIAKIEYLKSTAKLFALPMCFFFLMCFFSFKESFYKQGKN